MVGFVTASALRSTTMLTVLPSLRQVTVPCIGVVVLVCRFNSLNQYPAYVKTVVLATGERIGIRNDPAILLLGATTYFVVVAVLMCDKYYIGWNIVAFAFERVNVEYAGL